jgi:hypothetical protein
VDCPLTNNVPNSVVNKKRNLIIIFLIKWGLNFDIANFLNIVFMVLKYTYSKNGKINTKKYNPIIIKYSNDSIGFFVG